MKRFTVKDGKISRLGSIDTSLLSTLLVVYQNGLGRWESSDIMWTEAFTRLNVTLDIDHPPSYESMVDRLIALPSLSWVWTLSPMMSKVNASIVYFFSPVTYLIYLARVRAGINSDLTMSFDLQSNIPALGFRLRSKSDVCFVYHPWKMQIDVSYEDTPYTGPWEKVPFSSLTDVPHHLRLCRRMLALDPDPIIRRWFTSTIPELFNPSLPLVLDFTIIEQDPWEIKDVLFTLPVTPSTNEAFQYPIKAFGALNLPADLGNFRFPELAKAAYKPKIRVDSAREGQLGFKLINFAFPWSLKKMRLQDSAVRSQTSVSWAIISTQDGRANERISSDFWTPPEVIIEQYFDKYFPYVLPSTNMEPDVLDPYAVGLRLSLRFELLIVDSLENEFPTITCHGMSYNKWNNRYFPNFLISPNPTLSAPYGDELRGPRLIGHVFRGYIEDAKSAQDYYYWRQLDMFTFIEGYADDDHSHPLVPIPINEVDYVSQMNPKN